MKDAFKSRLEAFFEEFPFLKRYVKIDWRFWPEALKVERIDLDLLDRLGTTERYRKSQYSREDGERKFFLLDKKGEELAKVQPLDIIDVYDEKPTQFWNPSTWIGFVKSEQVGETVLEAIQKLKDQDSVYYILEVKDLTELMSRSVEFPDSEKHWIESLVVYKVPSGRAFSDWIANIRVIAKEELKAQLKVVDDV